MDAISLAEVRERLSELVDRAEAGETVEIMRDGRAVARIVPVETRAAEAPRKPIDVEALRELTSRLPRQTEGVVREMRDSAR